MNVPKKAIDAIRELYRQPTFKVEMDGQTSEWMSQTTGIRQGCPLSPYLFIILMSVLFRDIHANADLKLEEHRVQGMDTDEILYADDTICISENEQALSRLLAAIEMEGNKYGLQLNKKKCDYLHFGQAGPVVFADGTPVPKKHEVKYLGCNMNDRADPEREISKRKKETMITLNKLHIFFYNSDNTVTRKMQMFNAIIRAKLMYGLETVVMNTRVKHMLDAFQLKCLRKILKVPTTYIDRQFSNDNVRTQINNRLKEAKKKPMETLTAFHQRTRIHYLAKLIHKGHREPGTAVTMDPVTLAAIDHGKKRVGKPRLNWYQVTMQDLWQEVRKDHPSPSVRFAASLDIQRPIHVEAVKEFAKELTEKKEPEIDDEDIEATDAATLAHDVETLRLISLMSTPESEQATIKLTHYATTGILYYPPPPRDELR